MEKVNEDDNAVVMTLNELERAEAKFDKRDEVGSDIDDEELENLFDGLV